MTAVEFEKGIERLKEQNLLSSSFQLLEIKDGNAIGIDSSMCVLWNNQGYARQSIGTDIVLVKDDDKEGLCDAYVFDHKFNADLKI